MEYTGRGRELLIGFLLALAVLSPIYLGYFILGIEVERTRAFASLPLFVLFRARAIRALSRSPLPADAYNLARCAILDDGIRRQLRLSLFALDAVCHLSLGAAYPWRAAAIERYKKRHTRFGNLAGSFAASGGELFRQAGWI
jgi:hypothetical protein